MIAEFEQLPKVHKVKGTKPEKALRLVLVDGVTAYEAATPTDIAESQISRANARLRRPLCPQCGQPMP